MSYSNSGGGTLTLPSPTHVHHVDVTSAVRSLRRSLSRSPSKFRLVPKKSPSSSPKSPLSPTPLSPPKRASQGSIFSGLSSNPPHTPSPLAVPFPPSAKLALRSASRVKATPTRSSSRTRTSPRSPLKRALNHTLDTGNIVPTSLPVASGGQENSTGTSPIERKSFERIPKMPFTSESTPINYALSRLGGDGASDSNLTSSTSSPLKRSDAIMNLDQASLGSPVAKRRSLHGSGFGQDFNVFDHGPSSSSHFEILEDQNPDPVYELSTASITSDSNSAFMPRRSSSLRKSTLQQRHGEKTSWGRRHAAQLLAAQQAQVAAAAAVAAANSKPSEPPAPEVSTPSKERMNRPRLSMDQFVAPLPRDSPFTSQGSLPSASMHILNQNQAPHQPHPLSRTMTTSSSSSSILDESPTHVPLNFGEQPRPKLDFSKSLPAGSLRPFSLDGGLSDGSFATPQNYKSVKPLPAAFASTGLISKVNRNPEQPQITRGASKNVPDTPCKKHVNGAFATYPANMPGSALIKARNLRHSFGTPSTPFNFHGNQPTAGTFGKPTGVFGSSFGKNGLTRRGSFLSLDGYESGGSPDSKDGQANSESYPPPTPTKQALTQQQQNNQSPSNNRSLSASQSAFGLSKRLPKTSSKLNLSTSHSDQEGDESDESMDMNDSPTTAHGRVLRSSDTSLSFSRSQTDRNWNLHPQTLLPQSLSVPSPSPSTKPGFAKFSHVAPASPLERLDFMERLSPRTPQDNVVPPDPSGLSISNPRDAPASTTGGLSMSMPPPATPTTGREYFPAMGDRRQSTTPVSSFAPPEVDESLTSRFEKVEMIGTGEFSYVYKVTKTTPLNISAYFSLNASDSSPAKSPTTPTSQQVFAVKKSRQPISGTRDRQRKLQEVNVLKALGQSDHVVHLIDSWEDKYLYIQTEYCEEGSLDIFLSQVGRKGRLDDFRIWKIMLELSMVGSLPVFLFLPPDFYN
jgi:mitosis inhibitor protein kinase SWE1